MLKANTEWVRCPKCHCRTRVKVRKDTVLLNFPLYCPKCKQQFTVCVVNKKMIVTK
ncbi:conjugal transfer protein [Ruthenibacterium lactatiformans]|uniref:cysteine-rich KTR domain-containing protein n=1 Tax=Ruthenibacterium lactatiformans TaxID=1550024 RepID=UPI00196733B4|nr:cysteine-rich KTR domain-containing protein [Ruthenibacterium lactatiformans]MBN3027777.1 conjugal transfer protein [Ruthenibacterium lactatiformans]